MPHAAVDFCLGRVLVPAEAEEDQGDAPAEPLEERIDHLAGVPSRQVVFRRGAEIGDTGRFGSPPALAVVDAPRMDHDRGRVVGAKTVGKLDNPAGVIAEAPGPDIEITARFVDEYGRLVAGFFDDRLHELRIVGQQRGRIRKRREVIAIDPLAGGGSGIDGRRCGRRFFLSRCFAAGQKTQAETARQECAGSADNSQSMPFTRLHRISS